MRMVDSPDKILNSKPTPTQITSVIETTEDVQLKEMPVGMIGNKAKFANSRPTEEEKEESDSSKSGGWPI